MIRDYIVATLPAVASIDDGRSTCVRRYVESANLILRGYGLAYSFDDVRLTIVDFKAESPAALCRHGCDATDCGRCEADV